MVVPYVVLHNCVLVTEDDRRRVFDDGALVVVGDKIMDIGESSKILAQYTSNSETHGSIMLIDLCGKIVVPGFINTHVHTAQQLGRGLGDDVDLVTWLHDRIWPYESAMDEEDCYISALLCCCELINGGVTTFAEAGGPHAEAVIRAVDKIGMRAAISTSIMDCGDGLPSNWVKSTEDCINIQRNLYDKYNNTSEGKIRVWFNLRTIFNNSDALVRETKRLADELHTGIHMHVAEIKEEVEYCRDNRGATTVSHLEKLGALGPNLLSVHTVWLTDEEIDMIQKNNVGVVHCPAAAMRYLGFAKVPAMLAKGISVSIGTDGAPSNNRMTMVDEMWLTNLIHKGNNLDPKTVPAKTVLDMATRYGARNLLWDSELGSLEVGKKADLVVINQFTSNMAPLHSTVANIVTSMQAHNTESVMCNGKWLKWNGVITSVDEQWVVRTAIGRAKSIVERANIKL